MRKNFFPVMVFLLAIIVSPAWANSGGSPSATAGAVAGAHVTNNVTSAPTLAPSSNATVLSNQTTTVGINNQPTSVAIGGQGGQGGSAIVGIDLSNHDNKTIYSNRQFLHAGGAAPMPVSGNFTNLWEKWNIVPIRSNVFRVNYRAKKVKIRTVFYREHLDIRNLPRSHRVRTVGYVFDPIAQRRTYLPPSGRKVGNVMMVLPAEYVSQDCSQFAHSWAAEHGADQAEVIIAGGRLNPTFRGMSRYVSPTAGGLLGDLQKIAMSAVAGENESKTATANDSQSFCGFNAWISNERDKETVGIDMRKGNGGNGKKVPVAIKATN